MADETESTHATQLEAILEAIRRTLLDGGGSVTVHHDMPAGFEHTDRADCLCVPLRIDVPGVDG